MLYNCSVPSKTPPSRPCWGHTVDNRHLPTASDRFGRAPGFLWAPFGRTRPQKHTLGQTRDLKHRKLQVVQPNEIYRTLHYDAACILMAVLLDLYHDPFIELLNDPFLFQSVTLLFPIWLCTSHRLKGASGGGMIHAFKHLQVQGIPLVPGTDRSSHIGVSPVVRLCGCSFDSLAVTTWKVGCHIKNVMPQTLESKGFRSKKCNWQNHAGIVL